VNGDDPTEPLASPTLRGTAEPAEPSGSLTAEEDRSRRHALFERLHRAARENPEVHARDVRSFVEVHLRAALPRDMIANFRVGRENAHRAASELELVHHEWKIMHESERRDSVSEQYYLAYLNARSELVLVYGNSDAGAGEPHHFFSRALVIPLYHLAVMLPFIFARPDEFPPNWYGLS
jgi:hypothetical protein